VLRVHAYNDPEAIPYLIEWARTRYTAKKPADDAKRSLIYFFLGYIGRTTGDTRILPFFFEQIERETKTHILDDLAMYSCWQTNSLPDWKFFVPFVDHKNEYVQYAAILRLGDYRGSEVEGKLVELLGRSRRSDDLLCALAKAGSPACVPSVLPFLEAEPYGTLSVLAVHGGVEHLSLFIEHMALRDSEVKRIAYIGLCRFAGPEQADLINSTLKKFVKTRRKIVYREYGQEIESQFLAGLAALERLWGRSDAFSKTLALVAADPMGMLLDHERVFIREHYGVDCAARP
jgi:hypothetical protein